MVGKEKMDAGKRLTKLEGETHLQRKIDASFTSVTFLQLRNIDIDRTDQSLTSRYKKKLIIDRFSSFPANLNICLEHLPFVKIKSV